ncbi:MAG TPA: hypothetical protein VL400_24505 [Polyangiaceae bacterium]|nr:hypothetical protein [Polyangiaceae bacterium]
MTFGLLFRVAVVRGGREIAPYAEARDVIFGQGRYVQTVGRTGDAWLVQTDADVRAGDVVVVLLGASEHSIVAVEVVRSPVDPPPPRAVVLRLGAPAGALSPDASVVFVRRGPAAT